MANHLFDRALQLEGTRRAAATAAHAALAAAGTARRNADAAQTLAAHALLAAEDALAALRQQHAATPAAAAALSGALRQATVAQRGALALQLTRAAEADAAAGAEATARRAALGADQAWQQAQAELARARAAHEARRALIDDVLPAPPLDTLPADAAALLASQDHTDAAARIADALPAALLARARQRAGQARTLAQAGAARNAAQQEVDAQAEAFAEPASLLPRLQRALQQADAALAAYAGGAAARLASARATLADLAARTAPLVTAAQRAALQDLQGGARPAAATAEGAADAANVLIATTAAVLRGERLRALVREPGGDLATMETDATNHLDLAQAREDFDDAKTAAVAPLAAYTGAMKQTLAEWQAEVPDAVWSEAAALWAAEDTLEDLKLAPAPLVAAVGAAEDALLAALEDDDPVRQRAADAEAALAQQSALRDAGRAAAGRLAAAALSGPLVSAPWLQA